MNPRMMFSALALSSAALLTACGPNVSYEPVKNEAFAGLQSQPVQSYKLSPVIKITEGEKGAAATHQQLDGNFNIIVKTGEMKNAQALDKDGKPGSMLCSTFSIVSGKLDQMGKLNAEYVFITGGRYSRTGYVYSPVEINGDTISIAPRVNTTVGYTADLVAAPHKVCQFIPAAH